VDATRPAAVVLFAELVARDEGAEGGLRERRHKLVGEHAARFRGGLHEERGDASLCSFASAADAVACALAMQEELAGEAALAPRLGVHLRGEAGDVADRTGPLAEPGEVCVSSGVWEQVRGLEGLEAAPLGDGVWALKGRAAARRFLLPRRTWLRLALLAAGALILGLVALMTIPPARQAVVLGLIRANALHVYPGYDQEVRFTRAPDGVRIAWAAIGAGPAVVNFPGWASHLERGFGSPGNNIIVPLLMDSHRVLVYDGRGFGLSQHAVGDLSLEARVADAAAVMDAAGVERASVIGLSTAALPALAFAALHPERVDRLVLYGAATRFGQSPRDPSLRERLLALAQLMREGWDEEEPAYRSLFAGLFMPEAQPLMVRAYDELQHVAVNGDGIADFLEATLDIDVSALAPLVQAPTLLVHARGDGVVPFDEARRLAGLIPHAQLVDFEGRNHVPLPADEVTRELGPLIVEFLGQTPSAGRG
jgi:pimeloyl-ACP methyl ester carboxylesterase